MSRKKTTGPGEMCRDAVYRYLVAYKRLHGGASPSVREIMDALDIPSTSVVHYHLRVMDRAGRVRLLRRPGRKGYGAIGIPGERWLPPGE